jgi:hypothetical protein
MLPRHQITLRSILIFTAFVALFLGLRRSYLLAGAGIGGAHLVPPLIASLAVATSLIAAAESKFMRSIGLGASVSTIVALILALEITEGLRRMNYWDWSNDWLFFLEVIFGHTCIGAGIGLIVAGAHKVCVLVFSSRKKPVTPG